MKLIRSPILNIDIIDVNLYLHLYAGNPQSHRIRQRMKKLKKNDMPNEHESSHASFCPIPRLPHEDKLTFVPINR
jgi:hypothetical protein